MKVLVYGATGVQGSEVAKQLLEAGDSVRVITRDATRATHWANSGAEIAVANLDTGDGLAEAHEGVDAVFIQISASILPSQIVDHARNALRAAQDVPHVVVTTSSVVPPKKVGLAAPDARYDFAHLVREIVPNAILLVPTLFLENFSQALLPAIAQGMIPYPVPDDLPVSYISVEDQAKFAVAALKRPELQGNTYRIAGPDTLTGKQLSDKFTAILGRDVQYIAITPAAFQGELAKFIPDDIAEAVAQMYAYETRQGGHLLSPSLEQTLKDLPINQTAIEDWIRTQNWTIQQGKY